MNGDNIHLPSQEGENVKDENTENGNEERFESDTQKLVRKHLEDKNHVITDEDIANVRVGMVPPQFDGGAATESEGKETHEAAEENAAEETEDRKEDENLKDMQATPWDIIDPAK